MPYSTPYGKDCKIRVCSGETLAPMKEADLALSRLSQHPGRARGEKGALSSLRERLRAWFHVRCPMQDDVDLKQQKRIRELPLFLAAKENRHKDIRAWVARGLFDPFQRGAVGETALHVAALYGSTEAASALLDAALTLINEPMTSELYAGQVALHIAVLNQNLNLVTKLVERGAYVSTPKATGTFFQRRPQNLIYVGEHILSFAACMGNKEIVHLLIKNGANIKAQDSLGNTVLHILALQPNKAMSCQMFDFILSYEKGTKGTPLEKVLNKDGLTPFKLAAVEGNTEMFQHMVQKRKRVQRLLGPVSSTLYELTDIDSGGDVQSVLELVTSMGSREAYRTLGVTPVKELVYEKWKRYKGSYFSASGFSYVLYMVCFSLCCVNRPRKPCRSQDPTNGELFRETTLQESYVTSQDYLRLAGELISVTGAIAILLLQITDVLHAGCKRFFRKAMWAEPFGIMITSFALLVLLILVQRVSNADGEETAMCLALILGWCYTMYFSRGLKMLGPFTIMIQRMVVGDLWRFCWILAVVTVGYSADRCCCYNGGTQTATAPVAAHRDPWEGVWLEG
ncbi:transient receptor potential cation channel subfamily V member 6-like isoform X2 [Ambystoma mexicanum]|uniref:transient receptor potential cation channel subfamily V member 6-like isoform X2 n=1 Tax=Ambystoma mexicanum TaxID=8296 RepID=UPI0037E92426